MPNNAPFSFSSSPDTPGEGRVRVIRVSRCSTLEVMRVLDLGLMPYREAWSLQEKIHAEVAQGAEEHLLLVEHPPVITLGRRPGIAKNLLTSQKELSELGIDLVE